MSRYVTSYKYRSLSFLRAHLLKFSWENIFVLLDTFYPNLITTILYLHSIYTTTPNSSKKLNLLSTKWTLILTKYYWHLMNSSIINAVQCVNRRWHHPKLVLTASNGKLQGDSLSASHKTKKIDTKTSPKRILAIHFHYFLSFQYVKEERRINKLKIVCRDWFYTRYKNNFSAIYSEARSTCACFNLQVVDFSLLFETKRYLHKAI